MKDRKKEQTGAQESAVKQESRCRGKRGYGSRSLPLNHTKGKAEQKKVKKKKTARAKWYEKATSSVFSSLSDSSFALILRAM
jgi:hypothetical protein